IQAVPGTDGIENLQDENLVLLKKGNEPAMHFFMVHAGSGEVEEYIEFFEILSRLDPGLNGWGIRAKRLKNGSPKNLTIEELAAGYIDKIKKIQPNGPYRIAGWSIGGAIVFEMARQLEALNEPIAFLALIDTPGPQVELASQTQEFTLESEFAWLKEILPGLATSEKIKEISDIEQLWLLIADYLETTRFDINELRNAIPGYIIRSIPHIRQLEPRDLINSINRVRSLNNARDRYLPGGNVKTVMRFFGASETGKIFPQAWKSYCEERQEYKELQAGHYTLFKMPNTAVLAKLCKEVLSEQTKII
ncbi:MAG TPA: thioesterase domain-containing protein, partial [Candidatus Deferrimicrobium sp.]|nr:thioesterase domain-containing protein [Candidatus Deferrimicrobium sp.]